MHVALLNEGTYPVVHGGVSTWCDQLVKNLPEHEFSIVTLTGPQRESVWTMPSNVRHFQAEPMWGEVKRKWSFSALRAWRESSVVDSAYHRLWAAVLPTAGQPVDVDAASAALKVLAGDFAQPLMTHFASGVGTQALMEAWSAHIAGTLLPTMSGAEAADVSRHVDRLLGVLSVEWPKVDVIHATTNGPAGLMALGRHWRDGTPIVLTEHGVHLRERYLALRAARFPWTVRYALMAMSRAVCQSVYDHCELMTPVSEFNAGWERQLGAPARRVITVPNAVDATAFPAVEGEPEVPTVSFVGRIDPLKDLGTLIEAFVHVRAAVPNARLRLFGPTPAGNEAYKAGLDAIIDEHGLGECVSFEGAVPSARPAIEAGHVVALSSISEGLPYTVIESMMCGRATLSTDVGGVNECVGRDETCGLLVPPRDVQAMGEALTRLLTNDEERRAMGRNARARALSTFDLEKFTARYRFIYERAAATVAEDELLSVSTAIATTGDDSVGTGAASGEATGAPPVIGRVVAAGAPESSERYADEHSEVA